MTEPTRTNNLRITGVYSVRRDKFETDDPLVGKIVPATSLTSRTYSDESGWYYVLKPGTYDGVSVTGITGSTCIHGEWLPDEPQFKVGDRVRILSHAFEDTDPGWRGTTGVITELLDHPNQRWAIDLDPGQRKHGRARLATKIEHVSQPSDKVSVERIKEVARKYDATGVDQLLDLIEHQGYEVQRVHRLDFQWRVLKDGAAPIAGARTEEAAKAVLATKKVTEVDFALVEELTKRMARTHGWCTTWQMALNEVRPSPPEHPAYTAARVRHVQSQADVDHHRSRVAVYKDEHSIHAAHEVITGIDKTTGNLVVTVDGAIVHNAAL